MTAGATRIEGRVALAKRPHMEFGRKREYTGDTFDIGLVNPPAVFDVSAPLSFSAGTQHQILKFDGTDIIMGQGADGAHSRDVTRAMRTHRGEVVVSGTSAQGGPLRIVFPTDGFETAFRAMAAECGEGITYWIDDWGAVVQDSKGTLWHSMLHGTEEEAKEKTMAACKAESEAGNCDHLTSVLNQCVGVASGDKGDDWVNGWGTHPDLETAKRFAVEACTEDGASDCKLFMHLCSDNTNYWGAPSE